MNQDFLEDLYILDFFKLDYLNSFWSGSEEIEILPMNRYYQVFKQFYE